MKTYSNGIHSVTINSDRSIIVKHGDWLSKYSAAIHGDPKVHWGDYAREVNGNFINIDNPNQINVGEKIYYTGELPGWIGIPPTIVVQPAPSPTNETIEPTPDQVIQFLNWALRSLNPISQWSVAGSNDLGGGALFQLQAHQVGLKHIDENATRWFSGVCAGIGLSPITMGKVGVTWSSTWLSNGVGQVSGGYLSGLSFVAKGPLAGAELSAREFSGSFVRVDMGASVVVGAAGSLLAVGCKTPPEYLMRKMLEMMAGHSEFSWVPIAPMALIFLSGVNVGLDSGVSIKVGQMWETSSWTGNYL